MAHITKFNAFGFRLQLKHVHDLIHKFVEAHFITMQIKLTGFNFGDIQQAFNQIRQVFAAAQNHVYGVLAVFFGQGVFIE